jgi:hypothetical protein
VAFASEGRGHKFECCRASHHIGEWGTWLNRAIPGTSHVEHAILIDVEATPARTFDEVAATETMIERTKRRFDLKPKRLAADTAYGTGKIQEQEQSLHLPGR